MKKILVFSTNYLPYIGGAELAVKEIADRLTDVGFSLITARLKGSLPAFETVGRVSVYRVGLGSRFDKFLLPISGLLKAFSLHRQQPFDALWSMMASQASVAAAFFKILHRRVPLLLTLQEGDEEEHLRRYVFNNEFLFRFFIRPWHQLVFSVADRITVISEHLGARARSNNQSVPIVKIPNGVSINDFQKAANSENRTEIRNKFGFTNDDFVVITVSRLVQKNNVEDIIRAIASLPENYKLLIAGGGELEDSLRSLAVELAVFERVVFAGATAFEDVPRYLSGADVFVRPSLSEGFGSAFIEAMAAKVPVIATPVGGIIDFLDDKKTGLFCGVRDPRDLALKIQVLMRDRDLRASIITTAYEMVCGAYQWDAIANRMRDEAFVPLWSLQKERILIASGIFPPDIGGPAEYAKNLSEQFQSLGYVTRVCVFNRSLPAGIRNIEYFFRVFGHVLISDWVLALDTFSVGLPAVFSAWVLGRRSAVRIGGDFLWEQYINRTGNPISLPDFYAKEISLSMKEHVISGLTKFTLHLAQHGIFNSTWQKDLWTKAYGLLPERTDVVGNLYAPKEQGKLSDVKDFIWAGRNIPLKNVDRMRTAFDRVRAKLPTVSFEQVSLPHDQFLDRLRNAYAVIVPSFSEVSPNTILEAIRFNKPFIVTKYCGLPEHVLSLGITVDPFDVDSIAQAILRLSDDSEYKKKQQALEAFTKVHTWRDIASEFIGIFSKK